MSIPVSKALDTAVNIASLVVILGAGLLLFRRELGRSKPTVALDRPMEYVRDWKAFVSRGNRLGTPRAPLELLELSDYQCPACRSFNGLIRELIAANPKTISLTYLHYPLHCAGPTRPFTRCNETATSRYPYGFPMFS